MIHNSFPILQKYLRNCKRLWKKFQEKVIFIVAPFLEKYPRQNIQEILRKYPRKGIIPPALAWPPAP